jgi:hypothetical protein
MFERLSKDEIGYFYQHDVIQQQVTNGVREIYLNLQLTAPSTQQRIKLNFSFGQMNCKLVINRRQMPYVRIQ